MKPHLRKQIIVTVAIFVGLAFAFFALLFISKGLAEPFAQSVTVSVGSMLLGSGLTYFLIQMSRLSQK